MTQLTDILFLKNISQSHVSLPGLILAFLPLAAHFLSHLGLRLLDSPWSGQGHEEVKIAMVARVLQGPELVCGPSKSVECWVSYWIFNFF